MLIKRLTAITLAVLLVLGSGGVPLLAAAARIVTPPDLSGVSGSVDVSIGFESSDSQPVTRVSLFVDGEEYAVKAINPPQPRGVVSMLWDSTRFADGNRGLSVYIYSGAEMIAKSYVKVQVRNLSDAAQVAPPKGKEKVRFFNLRDGERVQGMKSVTIVTDDSLGVNPYIAVSIDRDLKYLSNRQPCTFPLDTTRLSDGTHLIEVEVRNADQDVIATTAQRINVENGTGSLAAEVRALATGSAGEPAVAVTPSAPAVLPAPAVEAETGAVEETDIAERASEVEVPATAGRPRTEAVVAAAPVQPAPPVLEAPRVSTAPAAPTRDETLPKLNAPAPSVSPLEAAAGPVQMAMRPAPAAPRADMPATPVSPSAPRAEVNPQVSEGQADVVPAEPATRWGSMQARAVPTESTIIRPSGVPEPKPVAPSPEPASSPISDVPQLRRDQNRTAASLATGKPRPVDEAQPSQPVAAAPPAQDPAASEAALDSSQQPESRWARYEARLVDAQPGIRPASVPDPEPVAAVEASEPVAAPEPVKPAAASLAVEASVSPDEVGPVDRPAFVEIAMLPKVQKLEPTARPQDPLMGPDPDVDTVAEDTFTYVERQPILGNGSSLVHLRSMVESFGGSVIWDHSAKTATASLNGRSVTADFRTGVVAVEGKRLEDCEARLVDDRAAISARAVAEALGLSATWDSKSRQVKVTGSKDKASA